MKKAIYKNTKIGYLTDVIVFEHEDFEEHNDAIPPYVRPKMGEDGRYRSIEVNKVGGYCYHLEGEDDERTNRKFIEYRYPESPYDEVLSFEEKVSINNPNFDCGWISPDGDTYWCEPRCHSDLANKISEEKFGEYNGEAFLEERGWIKVYHESELDDTCMFTPEGIFYNIDNLPTEKQLSVIKKLGRFTEQFKDHLRMSKKYH